MAGGELLATLSPDLWIRGSADLIFSLVGATLDWLNVRLRAHVEHGDRGIQQEFAEGRNGKSSLR